MLWSHAHRKELNPSHTKTPGFIKQIDSSMKMRTPALRRVAQREGITTNYQNRVSKRISVRFQNKKREHKESDQTTSSSTN